MEPPALNYNTTREKSNKKSCKGLKSLPQQWRKSNNRVHSTQTGG